MEQELIKRIFEVQRYHELSAATFAEKLNIPRSSLSHLASGRNKPSLDLLLRILRAFPGTNVDWLLHGRGEMFGQGKTENETIAAAERPATAHAGKSENSFTSVNKLTKEQTGTFEPDEPEKTTESLSDTPQTHAGFPFGKLAASVNQDKNIEHVILFYTDGTCKVYKNT